MTEDKAEKIMFYEVASPFGKGAKHLWELVSPRSST